MADLQKLESLLVADIGRDTTNVALVDLVAGEFRFVGAGIAATTTDDPVADVGVGVRNAIAQIQMQTERQILGDDGQLISPERPDGRGVDACVIVTSAPQPLRVAIVGLSREVSLTSAERAVKRTHATIEATLALDESGGRWLPAHAQVANEDGKMPIASALDPAVIAAEGLARANPEVIVLVGGTDGGATAALYDITNLVAAIVASRDEGTRPIVIFAGNNEARSQIAARLGQVTQLRPVDNVRPTMERENLQPLQHELETIYIEKKIAWLAGLNALTNWLATPVVPTARAFENVVRFLARRYNLRVLGADISRAAITVVSAHDETFTRVVRGDLGLSRQMENLPTPAEIDRLTEWLPIEMSAEAAELHWLNQALRPRAIPSTRAEAFLAQAAAHIALGETIATSDLDPQVDLIVLTGNLVARNTNLGALALLALDTIQPSGVFTLAVDTLGLVPAFGGLAAVNAEAAANVIERDGFVTLGTVLVPLSKNRDGQIDLRITVQTPNGGTMNVEVEHGSLELIPLPLGQKAMIEARPASGVTLGKPTSGIFKAEIEGGALGLIIDARGRPITLSTDAEKRRAQVQRWYWDLGSEVMND